MDHRRGLELALAEAQVGLEEGSAPIGAVIVDAAGNVIARGHNRELVAWDKTAHAETEAIRQAGEPIFDRNRAATWTLYTTWEPCLMCAAVIVRANLGTVVWAVSAPEPGRMLALAEAAYGHERTAPLVKVAEPDPELAARSRELRAQGPTR